MLRPWLRRLGALTVLGGLCAAGCGPGAASTAQVRGTVAYRGVRLRGGTIVFTPDSTRGTHGPQSYAEIQPDGSYTLRSGDGMGAVTGWHRVTVVAVQARPAGPGDGPFAVPMPLVPEKYRDPDQCGLTREVKANQANEIDFDLE
jgi:hypothetical protein